MTLQRYKKFSTHVHLRNNSEHISRHHSNWRLMTMERIISPTAQNVHYSGVVTLDKATADFVRDNLVQTLKENLQMIEQAPAKTAYVYNLDFFELLREL